MKLFFSLFGLWIFATMQIQAATLGNMSLQNKNAVDITGGTIAGTTITGYQTTVTFGANVQTALGVAIGSAGAPVLFNEAGGTPSSIVLTNATGSPTGISLTAAQLSTIVSDDNPAYLAASNTFTGTTNTFTIPTTTGTTATSGLVGVANSLSTGTAFDLSSSSITSGKLFNLLMTGNGPASGSPSLLNIALTGANTTNAITTTGATISNTRTNATSGTNEALVLTASGATTANTALRVAAGVLNLPAGSVSAPTIQFPSVGLYANLSTIGIIGGGTTIVTLANAGNSVVVGSGGYFGWSSTTNAALAQDTSIGRDSALTVRIYNNLVLPGTLAVTGTSTLTGAVTIGSGGTAITKVISATAALDFGSTAAGADTDLTITATGAALGDIVTIGIPNASMVSNAHFVWWVSATDTVTVRFHNDQVAGSLDPASGTFRVTVIKH